MISRPTVASFRHHRII